MKPKIDASPLGRAASLSPLTENVGLNIEDVSASPPRSRRNTVSGVSQDGRPSNEHKSSAAAQVMATVHRRLNPGTAVFLTAMGLLAPRPDKPATSWTALERSGSLIPKKSSGAIPMKKPATSSVPPADIPPKFDRAGNPRPANKRFLERSATTGKLTEPKIGQEDYTQLEEVQDWIKQKHYTKFDLMPPTSEYTFDDMDPEFITEPYSLKNQGRRLLMGKNAENEIWAVMPRAPRLYMPRVIRRNDVNSSFKLVTKLGRLGADDMPELDYPFEVFKHISDKNAWTELHTVIAYVFLICGEADIVFSASSKWPGTLSTAVTRIKQMYDPQDAQLTAETVDRTINARHVRTGPDEDNVSIADTDELTQLEIINKVLSEKRLLERMQAIVSDTSMFTFKTFKATVHAKNVQNSGNRALLLGENDDFATWAAVFRTPNKAGLGLIVNVDKMTGHQTEAKYWPDVPRALNYPFDALKERQDQLSWRKMQYVIGYVFLSCGEAEKALNLGDAFFRHFLSIIKAIEKHYGPVIAPEDPTGTTKLSNISVDDPSKSDATDDALALDAAGGNVILQPLVPNVDRQEISAFQGQNVVSPSIVTKIGGSRLVAAKELKEESIPGRTNSSRGPLRKINARSALPLSQTPRGIPNSSTYKPTAKHGRISTNSSRPTYTAPNTEYRSVEDLHVSLFLEEAYNINGKRPAHDERNDNNTKHMNIEGKKVEATDLLMYQEVATKKAKLAMEEARHVWEVEVQKVKLLKAYELGLTEQEEHYREE